MLRRILVNPFKRGWYKKIVYRIGFVGLFNLRKVTLIKVDSPLRFTSLVCGWACSGGMTSQDGGGKKWEDGNCCFVQYWLSLCQAVTSMPG